MVSEWISKLISNAPAFSIGISSAALAVSALAFRRGVLQNRAALVGDALKALISPGPIQDAFYTIEYGTFKYDASFHDSDIEKRIDALLRHLSVVAQWYRMGLIKRRDLAPFEYYMLRVARNSDVKKYIDFLADWARTAQVGSHPFMTFREVAAELDSRPAFHAMSNVIGRGSLAGE